MVETIEAATSETVDDVAASFQPGHCSAHPNMELVTHRRAGIRWHGYWEDPATACTSPDHDQTDQDRCRWCGGPVADPSKPLWSRSSRRTYCTPHHRLLAFRAARRAER